MEAPRVRRVGDSLPARCSRSARRPATRKTDRMAYDVADLRSQLSTATGRATPGVPAAPQYFEFGDLAPDHVSEAGTKTWLVRSQNCCVAYSVVQAGDRLVRTDQPDEYMVLFPAPDSSAVVIAGDERRDVAGETVAVVPPGDERDRDAVGRRGRARVLERRRRPARAMPQRSPTTSSPIRTWRRSRRGPIRPRGTASGSTRSPTCRTTPAASAGSSGAAR